ncbi:MAG: metallophosphoesterase [Pseudomonadota bacterium]|nr:metallophosphoesterase [Pseudomonadota bacterium]
MPRLIQALPPGPLALVGDIHGEVEALLALLHRLGVDPDRLRAARPVVFVGDLVDRGPDSIAVLEIVSRLTEAGLAHSVLGNHELNLLQEDRKEGNGWYWGDANDHAQLRGTPVPFRSRLATHAERATIRSFIRDLPLVLERDDLRVVHACWNAAEAARLPEAGDHAALADAFAEEIEADLARRGIPDRAAEERAAFEQLRDFGVRPDRHLPAVAEEDAAHQVRNPMKLLTSGAEVEVPQGGHFFVGGKWRFVARDRWWRRPVERPTVVGHYWRRRGPPIEGKMDVWDDLPPFAWAGGSADSEESPGGVFCVDYSVGRRFAERARGRDSDFDGGLAAMCWPERVLVFDDREAPVRTV